MAAIIVIAVVVVFALILAARTIRIIPQARAGVLTGEPRHPWLLGFHLLVVLVLGDETRGKSLEELSETRLAA